ncbi:hypothetical protein KUCAC02_003119 [Chaenocephalus aceratus]|uniref:Uncharacterized protein n=1 Tax=Chaenocephalus aceratus TaxID=36190 RepID=A0ACB9WL81_CHAAC|nr:hypothetical protein KUCAC02_003119 [Chaenocephalus aceratus]
MIDLSFLTEEEQDAILAVLRRDTQLKKAEEQRVLNLQKMVNDRGQLRVHDWRMVLRDQAVPSPGPHPRLRDHQGLHETLTQAADYM